MNNKGFTLVEFIGCVVLLGIVLFIGICATRRQLATSILFAKAISDDEIFFAARSYTKDNKINFDNGYYCITTNELIELGYLDYANNENKIIKIEGKNNKIKSINYVSRCE